MKEIIDKLNYEYSKYFSGLGYKKNESVKITSGVDESVVFIGSTISVLKSKLLQDKISYNGDYLIQRSIRTRGLKRELIPEKNEWSSYFDATGILVKYTDLDKLIYDIMEFLNKILNIKYEDILIRISKLDIDLNRGLLNINSNINVEYNTREESYYKHKYGLDIYDIYGRNFNIAIKDNISKQYKDIGNIIIIESQKKEYGVECAIGLNALIMRKLGIDNSIDSSSVVDVYKPSQLEDYKFLDCLAVVSHLAYENVLNIKKRSSEYLYKKYLRNLLFWAEKKEISNKELLYLIKSYLLIEYNNYDDFVIYNNVEKQLVKMRNGGF
jgi:hypothetical protein